MWKSQEVLSGYPKPREVFRIRVKKDGKIFTNILSRIDKTHYFGEIRKSRVSVPKPDPSTRLRALINLVCDQMYRCKQYQSLFSVVPVRALNILN